MGVIRKLKRNSRRSEYAVEPVRPEGFPLGRKMSEVLPEFAGPLLNAVDDELFESVISITAVCWNLSLFPQEQQHAQWKRTIKKIGKPPFLPRHQLEDWVWALVERKRKFFANDKRIIADFKVIDEGDLRRLFVMSTMKKE
jgi:hypothetical protein